MEIDKIHFGERWNVNEDNNKLEVRGGGEFYEPVTSTRYVFIILNYNHENEIFIYCRF